VSSTGSGSCRRQCTTARYLLGGRTSIADFGMMAAMSADLGRDPVPARPMKREDYLLVLA